jgi:hypothetical protein
MFVNNSDSQVDRAKGMNDPYVRVGGVGMLYESHDYEGNADILICKG